MVHNVSSTPVSFSLPVAFFHFYRSPSISPNRCNPLALTSSRAWHMADEIVATCTGRSNPGIHSALSTMKRPLGNRMSNLDHAQMKEGRNTTALRVPPAPSFHVLHSPSTALFPM